jgi:hypothetical protein
MEKCQEFLALLDSKKIRCVLDEHESGYHSNGGFIKWSKWSHLSSDYVGEPESEEWTSE